MKRQRLAILSRDKEYSRRLADYVRSSGFKESWEICAFTHPDACKQYVKQGFDIDLLAVEPEWYSEASLELPHIPLVALVNKLGESAGESEVLRYQPLPLLLDQLAERIGDALGHKSKGSAFGRKDGRALLIAIHSASGGVGKTALSLHLAHAASGRSLRVLYLNLERWSTAGLWLDFDGGHPDHSDAMNTMTAKGHFGTMKNSSPKGELSGLLYSLKADRDSAKRWLASYRNYHPLLKCDYLDGFSNLEDRMSLTPEEAETIVEAVVESGHYDLIVLDMDDGWDGLNFNLLDRSDHIYWMVTDSPSAIRKQSLAFAFGSQKWGERFSLLIGRSEVVRSGIYGHQSGPIAGHFASPYSPIVLPRVREWHLGGRPQLLSSSLYRAATGRLLDRVLGEEERAYAAR
ncbi:hypothetical protein ACFQZE_11305 [Paenibacillus sp. GCM10027627]|uniref:hypothetical protein n=1 Tax=unclassified Paenibacillus TaxID=185978 RepID=UPI003628CDAB